MNGPIGTGTGSREGCRTGCLLALLSVLVLLTVAAVFAAGLNEVTKSPCPTTSTKDCP